MEMVICRLQLTALILIVSFVWIVSSAVGGDSLSCEENSPVGYRCGEKGSQAECRTFAVLRANSYYSSLSNLSLYLGIDRAALAEANGFSAGTEFLPGEQPVLIPIECKCSGGFFEAKLTKTTTKGESFYGIAQALEGLTTCRGIREKNPRVSPWGLPENVRLDVPLRCACPSSADLARKWNLLLTYPVSLGNTLASLSKEFNTPPESIVSASNRSGEDFRPGSLLPFSTLLIPVAEKPVLGSLARQPAPIPVHRPRKKKSSMKKMGIYIATSAFAISTLVSAAFLIVRWRRKKSDKRKTDQFEQQQQLSLSMRTISDKHASFERSPDTVSTLILDTSPHKMALQTYTMEQLKKATEDFNSANHIEDSVYHGRLDGKNLAIKRTRKHVLSKIDIGLFYDPVVHHPNILRLYGTCTSEEGPDSYLVFEYAKNGSLKDWLHGGLAVKSHFIASCYCFLSWSQRLRICLDIAMALQVMHQVMSPRYVHRNIKSRNVFLDEDFNAMVGNFGIASCDQDDGEEDQITPWSKGYLAPEYLQHGVVAPSIDIFAYGVVLIEVLFGRTALAWATEKAENNVSLSERTKMVLASDEADGLKGWLDAALGEDYSVDAALALVKLAGDCVDDDPSLRPNAGEIVTRVAGLVGDVPQGEEFIVRESSCKPLVGAAAKVISM